MKLTIEQLKSISLGTVEVKQKEDGFEFLRFTDEQTELYKGVQDSFHLKTFSTAGVRLSFTTDSRTLGMEVTTSLSSSRKYYSFDIFSNGIPVGYLDNFERKPMPIPYTEAPFPLGEAKIEVNLGAGEKKIDIHFPWSVRVTLRSLTLDDGASLTPVKPSKKLLAFGDSITHGYDAFRPSNRYICKLADALGAEEYNKAIGGEVFRPSLGKTLDPFSPDYLTVAYGTNDWSKLSSLGEFRDNAFGFYHNLAANYPDAKIFALTPIWRRDMARVNNVGSYADVLCAIGDAVDGLKNVTLIECADAVPHSTNLYADYRLHPNDIGFWHYFMNVYNKIEKYL